MVTTNGLIYSVSLIFHRRNVPHIFTHSSHLLHVNPTLSFTPPTLRFYFALGTECMYAIRRECAM